MRKKGFTIVEMLVTIFFISVGITGVLIAIQQTMAYIDVLSLRLTAIYLAQEGIEIVRDIRDGNWLELVAWDTDLGEEDYEADYTMTDSLESWSDRYLRINGGFYNYSSGTITPFKRKITIDKLDLDGDTFPDQMKVTVIVEWEAKGEHQISAEEILYNWRQQ